MMFDLISFIFGIFIGILIMAVATMIRMKDPEYVKRWGPR